MPLTVIVDHNGGVDVHVAVKSNEYAQVDDYVKIHVGRKIHGSGAVFRHVLRICATRPGRTPLPQRFSACANRWNTNQVRFEARIHEHGGVAQGTPVDV